MLSLSSQFRESKIFMSSLDDASKAVIYGAVIQKSMHSDTAPRSFLCSTDKLAFTEVVEEILQQSIHWGTT